MWVQITDRKHAGSRKMYVGRGFQLMYFSELRLWVLAEEENFGQCAWREPTPCASRRGLRTDFYKHVSISNFALPDFGSFAFAAAGTVFEPDMPTVPAADDFTHLHDAFA